MELLDINVAGGDNSEDRSLVDIILNFLFFINREGFTQLRDNLLGWKLL